MYQGLAPWYNILFLSMQESKRKNIKDLRLNINYIGIY